MLDDTRREPRDWVSAVREAHAAEGDVLDLNTLRAGDTLSVRTQHTLYTFAWLGGGWGELQTDRPDRPSGRMRVNGCAFGAGTTIATDRLFNGGSLEFTSADRKWVHRTTPILWIRLARKLP